MAGRNGWYSTAPYPGYGVGAYALSGDEYPGDSAPPGAVQKTAEELTAACKNAGNLATWLVPGATFPGKTCVEYPHTFRAATGRSLKCCAPIEEKKPEDEKPVSAYDVAKANDIITGCKASGGQYTWLPLSAGLQGKTCVSYPEIKNAQGRVLKCCSAIVQDVVPSEDTIPGLDTVGPVLPEPPIEPPQKETNWLLYGGIALAAGAAIWYMTRPKKVEAGVTQNPQYEGGVPYYSEYHPSTKGRRYQVYHNGELVATREIWTETKSGFERLINHWNRTPLNESWEYVSLED